MSAVCGPHRPFPTFMRAGSPVQWSCSSGKVVVHEEQVVHLLGVELPVRLERHVLCSQLAGFLPAGQPSRAWAASLRGSKYKIQLTGSSFVVLLAQLGVVGLSRAGRCSSARP